jgi:hypothetical protein
MQRTTSSDNRSQILGFLGKVDRRLRFNDLLTRLARGLWGFAALLILLELTGLWARPWARSALLSAYGLGLVGYLGYRLLTDRALSRTAVVSDHRAGLHDTLTSAHAFLNLPERTDWMDFQIARAAESTDSLDAVQIAPASLPRPLFPALGVGIALLTLFSWNPTWLHEIEAPSWLTREGGRESETMEEILDEAEVVPDEEAKLEELEKALEELKRQEQTLELGEALGDLEAAQKALAASRVDMEQLEMDFDEIASNLDSTASLAELSEALKAHDAKQAAELLRELAERLSETQTPEELQALLDALSQSDLKQSDLAEMMENLENVSAEMAPESLAEMAQALLEAANQLEEMGAQMTASDGPKSEERGGASSQSAASQEPSSSQQAGDSAQQQPGDATQSASGMVSAQMQMAQMQGDPTAAVPMDAGPSGDATGPGGGESDVLGEATSLDVQLEREVIEQKEREEPIPEEIFERLSRQEKSTLNYEVIRQRGNYADESALTNESVPWPYRSLVKRYFMSIVAISEAKAESGEEK